MLADDSLGSGVVVSSTGDVVTNWHVVRGAKQVAVVFKPERGVDIRKELVFAVTLIKVDEVADLALLRVAQPLKDIPHLRLGDVAKIEVGQDAHSIGHPEGEVWTYTAGIVSQVRPDYEWTGTDGLAHHSKVIQTQTALNPGNSGGPLLNDRAEIIGINSFRREGEGLNYAVAADVVGKFLQSTEGRPAPRAARLPNAPVPRSELYAGNIVGAYISSSAPPPDVWLVYLNGPAREAAYAAMGSVDKTRIDTVIKSDGAGWTTLFYYFDTDCDGTIDLIGRTAEGSDEIESYQLPEGSLRLSTLASELVTALRQRKIPYPQIRFCE
ncbi:MAG: trypsin-like peptidase domain-containing protein [Candidatus Binatia bacterium]